MSYDVIVYSTNDTYLSFIDVGMEEPHSAEWPFAPLPVRAAEEVCELMEMGREQRPSTLR